MYIPRLLLLALLIPVCVAPVAAQTSLESKREPDRIPAASKPQLDWLIAPPEFRAHVLPLAPNVRARIRDIQPELSFDSSFESPSAQSDTDCYTMRSYRVTRDNPKSDSTSLVGYSECQPSARFQMKTAVDSREIAPR
jgi:hypothetical protein